MLALLLGKAVKKPKAEWQLSEFALHLLAVNVGVLSFNHANPTAHLFPAFCDEYGLSAAQVLRDSLVQRHGDAVRAAEIWTNWHHTQKAEQHKRWASLVHNLEVAIANVDAIIPLVKPSSPPRQRTSWHHYAVNLAKDFARRLHECNPAMTFGLAENGPVVAFVHAVIPFITGENPKLGNVANYLKTHRNEVLGVDGAATSFPSGN